MDEMSGKEYARLIAYLEKLGRDPAQILDCIKYVVGADQPPQEREAEKSEE